eukprot:1353063-Rhodomonas_salina.2
MMEHVATGRVSLVLRCQVGCHGGVQLSAGVQCTDTAYSAPYFAYNGAVLIAQAFGGTEGCRFETGGRRVRTPCPRPRPATTSSLSSVIGGKGVAGHTLTQRLATSFPCSALICDAFPSSRVGGRNSLQKAVRGRSGVGSTWQGPGQPLQRGHAPICGTLFVRAGHRALNAVGFGVADDMI